MTDVDSTWIEPELDDVDDYQIEEYELTSSPNDFNVLTIVNFIDSGAVKVPGFQRNYVWDSRRASKLIESLIIGLPVPQIFLYEESRNSFMVIDGQQRLMSIYYFVKQRFPRKEKRPELRLIFDREGSIPDQVLQDDNYFAKFNLDLPSPIPGKPNKFHGLNYSTLAEHRSSYELRTIRNVIVKQAIPKEDDSSIYEMFNRLNTGGINLKAQEIRTSLYHSPFYDMLYRANTQEAWRKLLGVSEPDLHMQDVEVLLRAFAILLEGDKYQPSMSKFLNRFSKMAKKYSVEQIAHFEELFTAFLVAINDVPRNLFAGGSGKFSVSVFESIFTAACANAIRDRNIQVPIVTQSAIASLRANKDYQAASQQATTNKTNVAMRIQIATKILAGG